MFQQMSSLPVAFKCKSLTNKCTSKSFRFTTKNFRDKYRVNSTSAVPITETWNSAKGESVSSEMEGKTPLKIDVDDAAYNAIDLNFKNAEEAFKSKTNFELMRSLLVFKLCSVPFFVNKNKEV